MYVCMCVRVCMYEMYVCMYEMYVCMRCMYVYVCTYEMYVCMYEMYVCTYVCVEAFSLSISRNPQHIWAPAVALPCSHEFTAGNQSEKRK